MRSSLAHPPLQIMHAFTRAVDQLPIVLKVLYAARRQRMFGKFPEQVGRQRDGLAAGEGDLVNLLHIFERGGQDLG